MLCAKVSLYSMSEQKNPKMFKTVFGGGYQKSDVNEYIESMQAQFISIEQTLKNTINHQAAELEELRCQIDATEDARDAADALQSTLDAAETTLTAVRAELEQSKSSCIAAEAGKVTAEASLAAA